MLDKFPPLFNIETDKEKIKDYIRNEVKIMFSEEGLEELVNPKEKLTNTNIMYYFNYENGEFKSLNFSVLNQIDKHICSQNDIKIPKGLNNKGFFGDLQ